MSVIDPTVYAQDAAMTCGPCPLLERSAILAHLLRQCAVQAHEDAGHRGAWLDCRWDTCLAVRLALEPVES